MSTDFMTVTTDSNKKPAEERGQGNFEGEASQRNPKEKGFGR